MLKRFHVNNFKSLLNLELRPVGLNLLIGPNNAGKTNLCSAVRFLGLSASMPLEGAIRSALGEAWNITNVYVSERSLESSVDAALSYRDEELDFSYRLRLAPDLPPDAGRRAINVEEEVLTLTGGTFQQTPLIENIAGHVRLLHESRFLDPTSDSDHIVETTAPTDTTMLCRLYDLETNQRANLFKRYLQTWDYFSLNPWALRNPAVIRDAPGLMADGRNLSHTLCALHNEKPRLERRIIEAVKALEPKLDLFSYKTPDPETVFFFLEDEKPNRFGAQSISDGTLRFMALTYLILSGAEREDWIGPPLYMIEEPENGLYVGHLKPLLQKIDPSGQNGQYIFTTHNPYFIDLFDSNLESVHLMKPGRPSSVLVKPDPEKITKLLDEMPLGEMHYREMLG